MNVQTALNLLFDNFMEIAIRTLSLIELRLHYNSACNDNKLTKRE